MTWLLAGIVIFFGIHLVPSSPALRGKLVRSMGEVPYKGAFSVLALAGLALMVTGMWRAGDIALRQPPEWAGMVPVVLMAPALILLAAANFNNRIRRAVRHPMSLGILLWSVGHLTASGGLAGVLLFGSFAVFSVFNICTANRRAAAPDSAAGEPLPAPKPALRRDILACTIGLAAYFVLATFHQTLFGVAVSF